MRQLLPGLSLFLLLLSGSVTALPLTEGQRSYVQRCIRHAINCDYAAALATADSAAAADSLDPMAPLCRLTALGVRDIDFDSLMDSAAFLCAFSEAERRCAAHEKAHGVSSFTETVSGFCKGFLAAYYLRNKLYLSALNKGFQSLGLLKDAYRLDSANTDPLFLLGLFEYAKGELKQRAGWVLFWYPGSKSTGMARLAACLEKGCFASTPAAFALAEIYTREKRPAECLSMVERLERDFPESRFLLWAKAKYFESQRLFDEAGRMYNLLASSYAAVPAGRCNSLLMRCRQARMLFEAGRMNEAADSCRSILRERPSEKETPISREAKNILERIDDGKSR